ncbi:MAG: hypothetical protein WBA00_10860 [Rhodococcus sp. (in: high G+C Gram-positive bacteria)]
MTAPDASALLRGGVVSAMSVLVTAAAHHLGGAMLPSESALVILVLVCAGTGSIAARVDTRRGHVPALMLSLAVAQVLGHFSLVVVNAHHHGPLIDSRMAVAHTLATTVGAVLIRAAELGMAEALSAVRRIVPLLLTALVVDGTTVRPFTPAARQNAATRLLDLSGCGTRGPPVRFR